MPGPVSVEVAIMTVPGADEAFETVPEILNGAPVELFVVSGVEVEADFELEGVFNHTYIVSEQLLERQLNFVAVKFHQLTSVFGHQTEDDAHLFRRKRASSLKLVGEAGEDLGVHAPEAHLVVIANSRFVLLVGRLIAEDRQQTALCPADVAREFRLQRFECVSFIHHTYIIAEHSANGNENLSKNTI